MSNYCEHIAQLTPPKLPPVKNYQCSSCRTTAPQVWLCQAKGCGVMVCQLNRNKHMTDHHEEFRKNHCIFINPITAELKCVLCRIEIFDFEQMPEEESRNLTRFSDPFLFRQRYLKSSEPSPQYGTGSLENSAAHKRSNRGLCGLSDRAHHSSISSTVQFLSNVPFYKSLMKHCRTESLKGDNCRLLQCLFTLVKKIWSGDSRVLPMSVLCRSMQELSKLTVEKLPKFKGYHRKDPFDLLIFLLNAMHEELKFYQVEDLRNLDELPEDDWDIIATVQKPKDEPIYTDYSPIKNPVQCDIAYTLECKPCKVTKMLKGQLFRLELDIPKIRKKSKEIEEQMGKHKYQSPFKRRRSLFDRLLGLEDQFPMSFVELLVEYMKTRTPQDKQKMICSSCGKQMVVGQCRYITLPKILLVKVNRAQKENELWSTQYVDFPDSIDLAGFTNPSFQGPTTYDLNSTVCLAQNNVEFFALARNCKNKQKYQFRGTTVKISNEKPPVYLACYTLRDQNASYYHNIKSNTQLDIRPECCLPEFWLVQLKYFNPGPLFQPMCCKHGRLRVRVESRSNQSNILPRAIYNVLLERYDGRELVNQQCVYCYKELCGLAMRKKKEKEAVSRFDGYKCKMFCMVACEWVNSWTDFLYRKKEFNYYLSKGLPPPSQIRNAVLLESQNKCRPDLKKGQDYKVVNLYVWTFFKELYGGGPEIQYRTKFQTNGKQAGIDAAVLTEIQDKVRQLKQYLDEQYFMSRDWQESPLKLPKASEEQYFRLGRELSREISSKDDK